MIRICNFQFFRRSHSIAKPGLISLTPRSIPFNSSISTVSHRHLSSNSANPSATANMGSISNNDDNPSTLPTSTPLKEISQAWRGPGSAAFDFRSDTITTPTLSMLRAIEQTTLMDDVYREDPTTNDFERWIAELTGKESALLVMSGYVTFPQLGMMGILLRLFHEDFVRSQKD